MPRYCIATSNGWVTISAQSREEAERIAAASAQEIEQHQREMVDRLRAIKQAKPDTEGSKSQ